MELTRTRKVTVLDHGYIRAIESWGSDERIVEAARMSTDKGFLGWDARTCDCVTASIADKFCLLCRGTGHLVGDAKLLRYLYEHQHSTPFEFAGLVIEVQAPIMVFREWQRHRTQSYGEMSARYMPLPDVNYEPTRDRCMVVNGANKQANTAAGASVLTHETALAWLAELDAVYDHAEVVYQHGLLAGIPKEIARLPLPVGRYSRMRASANLRNWLSFLTLRMDPNAQWEIRKYAGHVADIISDVFPRTWKLFEADKLGIAMADSTKPEPKQPPENRTMYGANAGGAA